MLHSPAWGKTHGLSACISLSVRSVRLWSPSPSHPPPSKPGSCFPPSQQRHHHWGLRVDHCWETTSVATRPKRRSLLRWIQAKTFFLASRSCGSFPQPVATPRFHIVDLQGQPLSRVAWLQFDENLGCCCCSHLDDSWFLWGHSSWNHGCSAGLKMATLRHSDGGNQTTLCFKTNHIFWIQTRSGQCRPVSAGVGQCPSFKLSWIWTCPCRHRFECKSTSPIYSGDKRCWDTENYWDIGSQHEQIHYRGEYRHSLQRIRSWWMNLDPVAVLGPSHGKGSVPSWWLLMVEQGWESSISMGFCMIFPSQLLGIPRFFDPLMAGIFLRSLDDRPLAWATWQDPEGRSWFRLRQFPQHFWFVKNPNRLRENIETWWDMAFTKQPIRKP